MQLISFDDTCTISRWTGESDDWDNPDRDVIYSGECLYEEGGAGYARSMFTRQPTLFLPTCDVQIAINDRVEIQTSFGRILSSVGRVVRDIKLEKFSMEITKIELKQATGD